MEILRTWVYCWAGFGMMGGGGGVGAIACAQAITCANQEKGTCVGNEKPILI